MERTHRERIVSIDLLRGVVIILMALDHVRMYFGQGSWYADPTVLATTTPLLFFTRWITHFCAPVFIFLAGTSAALYGARQQNTRQLFRYLLMRGLWIIFLELVVVNFAWTYDITFSFRFLQVIWAIGISMVVLAFLVYLPKWAIFAFGIIMVVGHNLLDPIQVQGTSSSSLIWYILHQKQLVVFSPDAVVNVVYQLIPLVGLMALGYVFGSFYQPGFDPAKRRMWLLRIGTAAFLLFLVLRVINQYGDPHPWSQQSTLVFSILSFLNTTKYPTSLQFLLMTVGPALVFLALTERANNQISKVVLTFGRVSLFFYILHIYVIHSLALAALQISGWDWTEYIVTARAFLSQRLAVFGFDPYVVYLVWGLVMLVTYPLCRWYLAYKKSHPQVRILSYI